MENGWWQSVPVVSGHFGALASPVDLPTHQGTLEKGEGLGTKSLCTKNGRIRSSLL